MAERERHHAGKKPSGTGSAPCEKGQLSSTGCLPHAHRHFRIAAGSQQPPVRTEGNSLSRRSLPRLQNEFRLFWFGRRSTSLCMSRCAQEVQRYCQCKKVNGRKFIASTWT